MNEKDKIQSISDLMWTVEDETLHLFSRCRHTFQNIFPEMYPHRFLCPVTTQSI